LVKHFPKIVDVGFTALIEEELDKIEEGKLDRLTVLQEFYKEFAEAFERAKREMESLKPKPIETEEICPECGSKLVIRTGRYGQFYACSAFPKCRYTRPLEEPKESSVPCPKCGGKLLKRYARKDRRSFFGCEHYPKCDFTVSQTPVKPCPSCKEGVLIEGKDGELVCSNKQCEHREPVAAPV
jgi:DNA topoisomerase I